jgi:hypothetical protein
MLGSGQTELVGSLVCRAHSGQRTLNGSSTEPQRIPGCRPALCQVTMATSAPTCRAMRLFPDDPPPPPSSPAKPKLTSAERRARQADRLTTIRLRMAIWHELDARGITTPAEIGAALGMLADEAIKLLTRQRWHEGDAALLEAVEARLVG